MQDIKVGPLTSVHPGKIAGVVPYALAMRGSCAERAFYGFTKSGAIKRATRYLTSN